MKLSQNKWLWGTFMWLLCGTFVQGATTLSSDGEWSRFRWFGDSGSFSSIDGPFDFTVPVGSAARLDVTDAFEIGDQFVIREGGIALGETLPPIAGTDFTRDPNLAFADAKWSSASFVFTEGDHSIDIETVSLANGQTLGGAFVRLSLETLSTPSWDTPEAIIYGTPLSELQLNAMPTSSVEGTLVYNPPLSTVLNAGSHTLAVTFVPDQAVHSEISQTVTIEVLKAPLTITADSKERPVGVSNPVFTASYDGLVNGDDAADLDTPATITTTATLDSPPNTYPISISAAEDANYAITFMPGTLTVSGQQTVSLAWDAPAAITYGQALNSTQLSASASVAGTFSYSPSAGTVLSAGLDQLLSVVFTPTDNNRFSSASSSVAIDVLPALLTISADDRVRTVGTTNPSFTVQTSGFVNGDTTDTLSSPIVVTTTATTSSPPANYPIVVSGATSDNYTIQFVPGSLEVTDKLVPQISWDQPASITYGTALSPLQLNANVDAIDGTTTYTPALGEILAAGAHPLTAVFTPSDADRYREVTQTVMLTVEPAPLLIQAEDLTRAPGFDNPPLTAIYSGWVNSETATELDLPVNLSTSAQRNSPPGDYPINASNASDPNYAITFSDGVLTITEKPVPELIWANPEAITYGNPLTEVQLSTTVTGAIAGEFSYAPPLSTVLDAGQHTLLVTFTPTDTTRHAIASASVTLTINPAKLTIRADDQMAIQSSTIFTGIDFVSVGNSNNPPRFHDDGFGSQLPYGAVETDFDIGKHEITNQRYTDFLNAIAKDDPMELFNASMENEARGGIVRKGDSPNFRYEAKPVMGNKPVVYVSFWDACRFCNWIHNGKPEGPQSADTTENGAYDLTDASKLFNNSVSRNANARVFIPTEDQWYKAAYHDPNKSDGYWLFGTQSDTIPDQALANAQGDVVNQTQNVANWGRAADWDSNLNGVIENEIVADNIGPEDGNVTTVGSGGIGSESFYGAADMSGNVGEWTETPLGTFGRIQRGGTWNVPQTLLSNDYRAPTITREEIRELGFRVARDSQNDEAILPPLTVQYEGFVNGDSASDLDAGLTVTTTASPTSSPGTYVITPQGASSGNYTITFEPGTLVINDRLIPEVTWAMPNTISYGVQLTSQQLNAVAQAADIELEGIFTYTPDVGTMLDAGQHELTVVFTPTDAQTYRPVSVSTTIQVTPAPLLVQVLDASRLVGSPNPVFSATFDGFVNGDTESDLDTAISFLTDADLTSPPGTYAIEAEGATANYTITVEPGTLVINDRLIPEVTWAMPNTISYGVQLTSQQLNAVAQAADIELEGIFTYTPDVGTMLDAGQHELTVVFTPTDAQTYRPVSVSTTIQVTPAPLLVQVLDASRLEGSPNPVFSATFDGFVNGDTESDLDTAISFQTDADPTSSPGTYAIEAEGATANYSITVEPGMLTVLPGQPTTFPDLAITSDDTDELSIAWQHTTGIVLAVSLDLITWNVISNEDVIVENGKSSVRLLVEGLQKRYVRLQRSE